MALFYTDLCVVDFALYNIFISFGIMAEDAKELFKNLNELRVVDLKKELEKRSLSKSGSKKDLIDRLKAVSFHISFSEIKTIKMRNCGNYYLQRIKCKNFVRNLVSPHVHTNVYNV